MSKSEIALQLTLAMINKGLYIVPSDSTNAALSHAIVDLYNTILANLSSEE